MTQHLLRWIDPRLQSSLESEWHRRRFERVEGLPRGVTVVLAGQRAAGKTTLLPEVAKVLRREAIDLDAWLERTHQRSIREWFSADERGFRDAERAGFRALPEGSIVAVGGGFLSNHLEVLRGCVVVEVPVSFETYCERLSADVGRPRLRPDLSVEEELREVFGERERRHAAARPMSFIEFLIRLERGERSRRVVTLPPHEAIEPFAWKAKHLGADLLEVRTDLHPAQLELLPASRAVKLLVAERGAPIPAAWRARASLLDREAAEGAGVVSFHASKPLTVDEALARWASLPEGALLKHVEPLGAPERFPQVLETQSRLIERFGAGRVTVLVTGPLALPFRAILNVRNALDYLALSPQWRAAEGQRLLADAAREAVRAHHDPTTERLAILGGAISHSRSPRVHVQPFDRIELPPDVDLDALIRVLRPHYRGFAVTNPFKKRLQAVAPESKVSAINTLVRAEGSWRGLNTDTAGARATWDALGQPAELTVLGDGGVTEALRLALPEVRLHVVKHAQPAASAVRGPTVWTWPADVAPPDWLRFEGASVAIVAYGAAAQRLAKSISERGGTPLRLGARWFIAQARQQRALWESAS